MILEKYTVNPFSENTYVLIKDEKAVIFDPGFMYASEMSGFLKLLEDNNARLEAILLTHAHIDHVLGIQKVKDRFDVPVYLHADDRYLWDNYMSQSAMFGFDVQPFDFDPEPINPSPKWSVGSFEFDVRFTPGHAPGHVVYYLKDQNMLIGGDTLFRESIGRTDLYKGDFNLLEQSIRQQLYVLPDQTTVFSGHGPETTIGHEKAHNPFVRPE